MEDMVNDLFQNVYAGKKVLITGIFGFKGSWLAFWLNQMGAEVSGYSLNPGGEYLHYPMLGLSCNTVIGDIRDNKSLAETFAKQKPDIVFHMAAQPLVRLSYRDPVDTFDTNVLGTLKVFEACRQAGSVKAIVNVTSDKCYDNKEWVWGYRETDPLGGHDPYSASKGCAELLTASYRNSYFPPSEYGKTHHVLLASARAGNVIGGGDWAEDRIVPDLVRAAISGKSLEIRNPGAIRPWQHVLDPLSGYLLLGQKLLQGDSSAAQAFNFGPSGEIPVTVGEIVHYFQSILPIDINVQPLSTPKVHEAVNLKLDCSKAAYQLKWNPVWDISSTLEKTAEWYKKFITERMARTGKDLEDYIRDAKEQQAEWTQS